MGSGDWNDGMNLVGIDGAGESVWLGFFLVTVLREFSGVARGRGDGEFAGRCEAEARRLGENLDREAWDGEWYRRAYFDDGSPLGSAINDECRSTPSPRAGRSSRHDGRAPLADGHEPSTGTSSVVTA
jgi:cellobiose phosphorylase